VSVRADFYNDPTPIAGSGYLMGMVFILPAIAYFANIITAFAIKLPYVTIKLLFLAIEMLQVAIELSFYSKKCHIYS